MAFKRIGNETRARQLEMDGGEKVLAATVISEERGTREREFVGAE